MTYYLALCTGLYLLFGIVVFSLRKPGYNHLKHTISELGEQDARDQKLVNYLLFLPVGIAIGTIGLISEGLAVKGLASAIAAGYTVAAFFPCDKGAPMDGSWKQNIHNLGGFAQYIGSIYFINEATINLLGIEKNHILMLLVGGTILLSFPGFALRGLAQRIVEIILFACLITMI